MNISKNVKMSIANTSAEGVAAATDLAGAIIDMAGFEGCMIVVTFGVITSGAVTTIKAQQGAEPAMGDAADLEGTSQTIADDDDEQTFYIDIYKPMERYLRLYTDRATQNAVIASATYYKYGAKDTPVTHSAGVSGETHVSPDEGTA